MSVPKKAIPTLKKAMERIDDGDGKFARLGNWRIALGGYDEGYDVAYRGKDVFRVNYEWREYEVLDHSIAHDVIEDMKVALECQGFNDVTEWEDEDDECTDDPCLAPPFAVLDHGDRSSIIDCEGRTFMFEHGAQVFVEELCIVLNENSERLVKAWQESVNTEKGRRSGASR